MDIDSTRDVLSAIRSVLLQLARHQDDIAASEAAATPYWTTCPASVLGHREAASALRAQADSLVAAS
jgi:hypothetical protein